MDSFQLRLLAWYDIHARILPWRISPQDYQLGIRANPYHVWLSEVMLQQTKVSVVKGYFEKFIKKWPTIIDLAKAKEDEIMQAWAGLGYYSRARNLKACADIIVNVYQAAFPITQAELKKLPGIGDYTSAAILTIAFNQVAEVVDGNIERVVTRHSANGIPLPKAKEDCRKFMGENTPEDRPGDFVQAMMDLGATICTPRNPGCDQCPVNANCLSKHAGTMLDFPVKPPRKAKPTRRGAVFIIERNDGAIWLHKRPDKGLLAGMAGLPTTNWTVTKDGAVGSNAAPFAGDWLKRSSILHTFTHFNLELEVWHLKTNKTMEQGWWSFPRAIKDEALPSVMKKAVTSALPNLLTTKDST